MRRAGGSLGFTWTPPKPLIWTPPIFGGEWAARGGEWGGPDEGLLERGARGGERGCVGARGGREGARGSKQILTWTGGERGRERVEGGERGARGTIRFIGIKSTSTP